MLLLALAAGGAWWYRGHREAERAAEAERQRVATVVAEVDRLPDVLDRTRMIRIENNL